MRRLGFLSFVDFHRGYGPKHHDATGDTTLVVQRPLGDDVAVRDADQRAAMALRINLTSAEASEPRRSRLARSVRTSYETVRLVGRFDGHLVGLPDGESSRCQRRPTGRALA